MKESDKDALVDFIASESDYAEQLREAIGDLLARSNTEGTTHDDRVSFRREAQILRVQLLAVEALIMTARRRYISASFSDDQSSEGGVLAFLPVTG